jgi:hypothetical protein
MEVLIKPEFRFRILKPIFLKSTKLFKILKDHLQVIQFLLKMINLVFKLKKGITSFTN